MHGRAGAFFERHELDDRRAIDPEVLGDPAQGVRDADAEVGTVELDQRLREVGDEGLEGEPVGEGRLRPSPAPAVGQQRDDERPWAAITVAAPSRCQR